MNKRQRKKCLEKYGTIQPFPTASTLLNRARRLTPVILRDFNTTWSNIQRYLAEHNALEVERIERGPMRWVGYYEPTGDSSKERGPRSAAGKEKDL